MVSHCNFEYICIYYVFLINGDYNNCWNTIFFNRYYRNHLLVGLWNLALHFYLKTALNQLFVSHCIYLHILCFQLRLMGIYNLCLNTKFEYVWDYMYSSIFVITFDIVFIYLITILNQSLSNIQTTIYTITDLYIKLLNVSNVFLLH